MLLDVFRSIRAKLNASAITFLAIVVALAVVASTAIYSLDRSADAISTKWVAGSQILGELSDRISEFRIAETYRALTTSAEAANEAEGAAQKHAQAIADRSKLYKSVVGPDFASAEWEAFDKAWQAYVSAHEDWVKSDEKLDQDGPARQGSALHTLYQKADEASDRLIARNAGAAVAEAAAADRLARTNTSAVLMSALLAGVLTVVVIGFVERRVAGPLATMTSALSNVASGSEDCWVPEVNRSDEIGAMAEALSVFRSNAIALANAQDLAATLARYDALTGLPNRRLFASELGAALDETARDDAGCIVLVIDLDRFKPVNDLYGHGTGDLVLCEVAKRLNRIVGSSGLAARLGSDEFAILRRSQGDPDRIASAVALARDAVDALSDPFVMKDVVVRIGASVGISLCRQDGADADTLLRAADLAMYCAKGDGRGTFRFFEGNMDEELRKRAALEEDLREALRDHAVRPFYQPLVSIADEQIRGFEVLARWQHPERGFVSPDVFIPLSDQLGLMGQLTASILAQACRDAREWDSSISLAVNISPAQFQDPSLPLSILSVLAAEDFPPSRLELEVTESALVGDIERARNTLEALQRAGIKVALDDFGTGYSSLYHLRELKFDKIKIDRSFVQSMQSNSGSRKIVDAVLGLARSLDMPAVAEGIEDRSTLLMLADRGCTFGQGFYFSRAVPCAAAQHLLANAPGFQKSPALMANAA